VTVESGFRTRSPEQPRITPVVAVVVSDAKERRLVTPLRVQVGSVAVEQAGQPGLRVRRTRVAVVEAVGCSKQAEMVAPASSSSVTAPLNRERVHRKRVNTSMPQATPFELFPSQTLALAPGRFPMASHLLMLS
jgi:hypothetical protein